MHDFGFRTHVQIDFIVSYEHMVTNLQIDVFGVRFFNFLKISAKFKFLGVHHIFFYGKGYYLYPPFFSENGV